MIPEGITIYGEVIGYVPNSSTGIQTRGGKVYDYGCKSGENKLMIYRVTQNYLDGTTREYEIWEVIEFTKRLVADNPQIKDNILNYLYCIMVNCVICILILTLKPIGMRILLLV